MLNHEYELAYDLPDNCAIDVQEDRGRVLFRVNGNLSPAQIMAALNSGAEAVLGGGHWFQEWHGDIISRLDPITPRRQMPRQAPGAHGMEEYGAA